MPTYKQWIYFVNCSGNVDDILLFVLQLHSVMCFLESVALSVCAKIIEETRLLLP